LIRIRVDKSGKFKTVNIIDELLAIVNENDKLEIKLNDKIIFSECPQNETECMEDFAFRHNMNKSKNKYVDTDNININNNEGQINYCSGSGTINVSQDKKQYDGGRHNQD
jgi:hypothetical protein